MKNEKIYLKISFPFWKKEGRDRFDLSLGYIKFITKVPALQIKVINGKIISKVPMREFLFEPRHTPIGGMSFSLFKCIAAV